MKLCSYVVVYDFGFAPNPFWGLCTLAACTPNHQGLRLQDGDWLLGNTSAKKGHELIYAMRVSEVLDFDKYYRDPRFEKKKASAVDWQHSCGDNIYFRDEKGQLDQGTAFFHDNPKDFKKDTRYPRVFVSDHFFYFGENAREFPGEYASLIQSRQGCRYADNAEIALDFVNWLERMYPPGIHGQPRDRHKNPRYRDKKPPNLIQIESSSLPKG